MIVDLALKLSRLIHTTCETKVPHDIGIEVQEEILKGYVIIPRSEMEDRIESLGYENDNLLVTYANCTSEETRSFIASRFVQIKLELNWLNKMKNGK